MSGFGQLSKLFCCAYCYCCDYSESYVSINERRYSIKKLLGEGNFCFVYLVQRIGGTTLNSIIGTDFYTLKRIRCPFGNIESISGSMKEVDNYKRFRSPYIIHLVDYQVAQLRDGSKNVYILLPYFPLGSLKDSIGRNLLKGTFVSESECIRLIIGIARGLRCLHDPSARSEDGEEQQDRDAVSVSYSNEAALLLEDTPLELDILSSSNNMNSNSNSYAHRDLRPSNILFSSDGLPVISDLGSCSRADLSVNTRSQLTELQSWVSDHCTTAYTAPELLDIALNHGINTKVDIWSLGCICYFTLFGISPFEREEQVSGASLRYAIGTGRFSFPSQDRYSEGLLKLITSCLQVDASARPDINQLLTLLQELQES